MAEDKMICRKCGREKRAVEFYKMKTGQRYDMCKTCLTAHIDNRNTDSFLWILELFDVPYIESDWIRISNKQWLKDPAKFGPMSVLGPYLREMNMTQNKGYTYQDSDRLNFSVSRRVEDASSPANEEELANFEKVLKQKLENKEITQAEYDTMTLSNKDLESSLRFLNGETPQEHLSGEPDNKTLSKYLRTGISEQELMTQLTEDDIQYLMLKWGGHYKPSEWIAMEDMYNKYSAEFELNVDREETLKKMCRTSVKMDQALDMGDISAYRSFSQVLKDLRTSGKFTEVQNKEGIQQTRYLDTIGELVKFCEREGGIIEEYPLDPVEYPQDKIDLTIKDLKAYDYNLITNELGLGDLIESYIKKLEAAEAAGEATEDQLITSAEEEYEQRLSDDESLQFHEWLNTDIERDAERLLAALGDDLGGGIL